MNTQASIQNTPAPTAGNLLGQLGPMRQLGYVVKDLEASVAAWQTTLGVGPWTLMRGISLACEFEGRPSTPQIDIALAYRGDMQIELIQQRNSEPSPYLAHIEQGHFGLHHSAFLSERIDADVEALGRAGLQLVCDIRMPLGGRYVYFRSPIAEEHSYIELLEATALMKQMFAAGIQSARKWQGPARPLVIQLAWPLKLAALLARLGKALQPSSHSRN